MGPQRRARRGDGEVLMSGVPGKKKKMEVGWGLLGLERKVTSPNNFKVKSFVGGVVRNDGQY